MIRRRCRHVHCPRQSQAAFDPLLHRKSFFTPDRDRTDAVLVYTFDRLADVIEGFTEAVSLERYALYIFDYGAPLGLRSAKRHPEPVSAIASQNGNAYPPCQETSLRFNTGG